MAKGPEASIGFSTEYSPHLGHTLNIKPSFIALIIAGYQFDFTRAQAVDYQHGMVCVHTQPKAVVSIRATYCSGYTAKSRNLQGTRYTDSHRNYRWYWKPETKCRGTATAFVTANWNG